jgi:hypothetical protein
MAMSPHTSFYVISLQEHCENNANSTGSAKQNRTKVTHAHNILQ